MSKLLAILLVGALVFPATSLAQTGSHEPTAQGSGLTDGEIRKVDKAQGKVTLAHEPIRSLGMPRMTMVFRVPDPAMLDQVKPGDKVRFAADKIDGKYTVTRWEISK
ncbi:MAG: copper-binding protein [Burkholderiales bacterium]|nr:copper-binding protein [Burkholderiales bacterium]